MALSSAPLFDDEMVGRQIGAYKIEREVGRGGMGAVYRQVAPTSIFKRGLPSNLLNAVWAAILSFAAFLANNRYLPT